ncbi:MAG: enoyl-CoA hydratase/isomerase family protein [Clostridia bacterium]|jgi:enoyl-CoA hydratase/3-hydroxyacyl-CoA dehydrogenase|nr:enoyl-CoA hydratase/isomerase family protein [Clostridia bacterium]
MDYQSKLYPSGLNPLLKTPRRELPREVAMIGAGTIGPDIGYYLKSALPHIKLILVDVSQEQLDKAEKRLTGYAQKAVAKRKMTEEKAAATLENIIYTTNYAEIKNADLVIEAATENIPLKQRIFAQIEELVGEDTIITSNTSSIPAERIFSNMKRPERTSVTHFFAPAWRSLPVEVITWEKADQEIVDYLNWMFAVTGKVPLVTADAICFMLDRIFDNWCNEAGYLLDLATAGEIDSVSEEFVHAGPFFVLNLSNGNPIIVETNTLQMEEGDHYLPARIFNSVDRWNTKKLGQKLEGISPEVKSAIRDRLLGILFSQSFDIIDREIGTPGDLNFGCQIALGFRKGPLDIMKELGDAEVQRIMDKFQAERPGFPGPLKELSFYQRFKRHILVDEIEGVQVITIRRPQVLNAINDEVTNEILEVLQEGSSNPDVKGFVITGYGSAAFSAGADIGRFPEVLGDKETAAQYARDCAQVQQFMDAMDKPLVAAISGFALGGGLELALRCHEIVAVKNATFRFPEITLGILPGIGGCIVPYRRWPQGAKVFNEMICFAKQINAQTAAEIGMVTCLVDDYSQLIDKAVESVHQLEGKVQKIQGGKVDIPEIEVPEQPMAGKLLLSREAVLITVDTVRKGAAADSLAEALEIGYQGSGDIACTAAAKEGISAFLEKRPPKY